MIHRPIKRLILRWRLVRLREQRATCLDEVMDARQRGDERAERWWSGRLWDVCLEIQRLDEKLCEAGGER